MSWGEPLVRGRITNSRSSGARTRSTVSKRTAADLSMSEIVRCRIPALAANCSCVKPSSRRRWRTIVAKTPNGESPLVHGAQPILGCDVWEHSYYIDYRNRRPDYLKAFLDHLVNWEYVAELAK